MKNTAALFFVLFSVSLGIMGCDRYEVKDNRAGNPTNVARSSSLVFDDVLDYGSNVYYFPMRGASFGNELSRFLSLYPDLEVSAIAGDDTGFQGSTAGYFVTFKSKTPPQQ